MFKKISAFILSLSLFATVLSTIPASASASNVDRIESESKEIQLLEKELKFYFEDIGSLTDTGYVIHDKERFLERVDAGDPTALKVNEIISNGNGGKTQESPASFGKCVVNKFVNSYGNIARQFLTGSIFIYIKKKQYDLAARLMFNTLLKAGFKTNAATIAIEAGVYGWQCRKHF